MINYVILAIGIPWMIYKAVVKKELYLFFIALSVLFSNLTKFPFHVDPKVSWGLLGGISVLAMLYDLFMSKRSKPTFPFAVIFFILAFFYFLR